MHAFDAAKRSLLTRVQHSWRVRRSTTRPGGDADPAAAAEADLSSCQAWFAEAGWGAEASDEPALAVWDARVDLLLTRVQAAAEGKPDRWAPLQLKEQW